MAIAIISHERIGSGIVTAIAVEAPLDMPAIGVIAVTVIVATIKVASQVDPVSFSISETYPTPTEVDTVIVIMAVVMPVMVVMKVVVVIPVGMGGISVAIISTANLSQEVGIRKSGTRIANRTNLSGYNCRCRD